MALSDKTAAYFWREAVRDINVDIEPLAFEKYNLINRTQEMVQGMFADLVGEAYLKETTAVLSTTGKYYVSGASWVASTNSLTATMDTAWASSDVGNLVVFRDGTSVYVGTITSRTSGTVVVLAGDNLPSADIATLEDVLMAATTLTGDSLNISSLRLLRYGTQLNVTIRSTVTDQIETLPRESFPKFNTTSPQNRNKIAWMLVGDTVYLSKGSSLSSYGTITIQYPALPTDVTSDSDYVDLLDGNMLQIGIAMLRAKVQRRLSVPIPDEDKRDVRDLVMMLYNSFGQDVKKELVEQKLESLL